MSLVIIVFRAALEQKKYYLIAEYVSFGEVDPVAVQLIAIGGVLGAVWTFLHRSSTSDVS
jgi:hypothetical protein